jgi:peptidoglycan LD-endopeptidase CwlK
MSDWEQLNAERLGQVHPVLASRIQTFIDRMGLLGIPVLVAQGLRTWEEQSRLYEQGRTLPGPIVTKARPGYSWHQFGLAVDLVPSAQEDERTPDWDDTHPDWKMLLKVGRDFRLTEGALWRTMPDKPHFQPAELTLTPAEEIRELYHKGGNAAVWAWFSDYVKRGQQQQIKRV